MAQIEAYLKRFFSECNLSFLDDYYDLYEFVPNEELRKLLAAFHTQLNHWFAVLNQDIIVQYDEDGNPIYSGGYFHAQDSRDYLALISSIDQLKSRLNSSEYAFKISNDQYDERIRQCRRFVAKSRGSTIPEGFAPIDLEELSPIFQMVKSVGLTHDKKTLYANLKSEGEGSYARVFSYVDPFYQVPVILKRARPELDNKELARFKQEFEILKQLKSPYVIEAYSYDDVSKEYTMEFMDETIYKYINRTNATLSLGDRKKIIFQVCRGLMYIHSKGILHRDISLTNVFIKHYEDTDVVKIGDFGLVKIPDSTLTSLQSEIKGSLNDSDLVNVGFANYEMCHETFALTRLCYFILTGRTNISKQKDGTIKQFWDKGTNPDKTKRFQAVEEIMMAIRQITEENK